MRKSRILFTPKGIDYDVKEFQRRLKLLEQHNINFKWRFGDRICVSDKDSLKANNLILKDAKYSGHIV